MTTIIVVGAIAWLGLMLVGAAFLRAAARGDAATDALARESLQPEAGLPQAPRESERERPRWTLDPQPAEGRPAEADADVSARPLEQ